jgi:hypothetical protein
MDNDVPFLALELLQGESLDSWLGRGCRPALPELLRMGREIALGLAAAHATGLIHRDLPELRRLESLKSIDTKSPPQFSPRQFWNKLDAGKLK